MVNTLLTLADVFFYKTKLSRSHLHAAHALGKLGRTPLDFEGQVELDHFLNLLVLIDTLCYKSRTYRFLNLA